MIKNDKSTESTRFFYNVIKTDHCWIWNGSSQLKNKSGYGRFYLSKRKTMFAHRWSFSFHKGPIPEEKIVCHSCDNPICVNPDHLFLGTYKDNIQDAIQKGRLIIDKNRLANISKSKTHCVRGHEFNEKNTYLKLVKSRNKEYVSRICRSCRYIKKHAWRKNRRKKLLQHPQLS